jgi:DNA-binding transcriptional LysR family regulator
MNFDLELLRSFIVLAEEGHVGRAARRLFISQPALSKRIRRIEDVFGTKLVRAEGRGLALTPAGVALAEAATAIVQSIDSAVNLVRATARADARHVEIGFVAPMPRQITSDLVRHMADQHEVDIVLRSISWDNQVSAVVSGQVDIALVRGPIEPGREIFAEVLFEEPRVAAFCRDHPLADAEILEMSDIASEPIVVSAPNVEFWTVDPRPDGSSPILGPTVLNVAEILETVASGSAMALPAQSMGEHYVRSDIAYVPIRDVEPSTVVAIWAARPLAEPVLNALDLIRESVAELA